MYPDILLGFGTWANDQSTYVVIANLVYDMGPNDPYCVNGRKYYDRRFCYYPKFNEYGQISLRTKYIRKIFTYNEGDGCIRQPN